METYEVNGNNFNIQIFCQNDNDSLIQRFDGELIDKVITNTKQMEIPVYKIVDENNKNMFIAQFEEEEVYYVISSSIDKEEFTKILRNIEIKKI